MASTEGSFDIATALKELKHEMKNQKMKGLPANMTVQRRPLHHGPVASPHAGSDVQKVVYVSSRTPLMSAVKRVRRLLSSVEKRAIQSSEAKSRESARTAPILTATELHRGVAREEILVRASGRAMQQALRIGEWFRTKETQTSCKIEVRSGSVQAVDDIVEVESLCEADGDVGQIGEEPAAETSGNIVLEGGDTTMELLGNFSEQRTADLTTIESEVKKAENDQVSAEATTQKRKRKRKRKRALYEKDHVPEARIRWVKTVEVAISLR